MRTKVILGAIASVMLILAVVFNRQYENSYVEIDSTEIHEIESVVTNMRSDLDIMPSSNTTYYITTEISGEIKVSYEDYSACSIGSTVMLYEYDGNYYANTTALERQNQNSTADRYLILTFVCALSGIFFAILAVISVERKKGETA